MTKIPARVRARLLELADKAAVTAAEGALLALGDHVGEGQGVDVWTVDPQRLVGFALGGALLSLLINVARGGLTGRSAQ